MEDDKTVNRINRGDMTLGDTRAGHPIPSVSAATIALSNITAGGPFPEMKTFASGAKSTIKKPRYDLIPQKALELVAGRFEYGAGRHGERNYRKGKNDNEFITDRINHLIEHCVKFAEHRRSSDLAAILCNAAILADVDADTDKDMDES